MINLYKKIGGTLTAIYILGLVKFAHAQDAIISKPVGAGILPGAGSEGADIKSSILFAKIIPFFISWTINLAIGLAVISLILGGYMYLTSYGDEEKRSKGTRTILYAVIGLVIALTAYGIVAILTSIQLS